MQNTHLSYIVETCSPMQRLVNNKGFTKMQKTHHGEALVIHTALSALAHTLSYLSLSADHVLGRGQSF